MNDKNLEALSALVPACRRSLLDCIELVVSRFEKNPDYPFIDTKISTLNGNDFDEPSDPEIDYKGKTAIFGWIQGRGLEALAGHASFLSDDKKLISRCDRMLEAVAKQQLKFAKLNKGRFSFLTTPDGKPFRCGADGRRQYFSALQQAPGFADLFTGKGFAAAGVRLFDREMIDLGINTFRNATEKVRDYSFVSDQISFDPKNPIRPVPGKIGQGPWMISLGGYALFCELFPEEEIWRKDGAYFLKTILDRHIFMHKGGTLQRYDFIENIDSKGKPWTDQGKVLQDSGHALEFTGFAARFLLNAKEASMGSKDFKELLEECRLLLPEIFLAAFKNSFQKKAGGIYKTFDLVSRTPINDDMPWWSLPETLRAVALLLKLSPDHPRAGEIAEAAKESGSALFGPFQSPVPGLFYQTRDTKGYPVNSIPATPDADPGYHTGLCFIDFIKACE